MPPFDRDELADALARRQQHWRERGVELGELTWRSDDTVWPRAIVTDRSAGVDPGSVGLTLHVTDDDQAEVVFWRHGRAGVSALIRGDEVHDRPDLEDVPACIAYVDRLIDRLTAAGPSSGESQECPGRTELDHGDAGEPRAAAGPRGRAAPGRRGKPYEPRPH